MGLCGLFTDHEVSAPTLRKGSNQLSVAQGRTRDLSWDTAGVDRQQSQPVAAMLRYTDNLSLYYLTGLCHLAGRNFQLVLPFGLGALVRHNCLSQCSTALQCTCRLGAARRRTRNPYRLGHPVRFRAGFYSTWPFLACISSVPCFDFALACFNCVGLKTWLSCFYSGQV